MKYGLAIVQKIPKWSRPARGGWIEIPVADVVSKPLVVPPRTGRVD